MWHVDRLQLPALRSRHFRSHKQFSPIPAEAVLDFTPQAWLCGGMNEDTATLIAALCARAGMLMEDVIEGALTIGLCDSGERSWRLDHLSKTSDQISVLITAACVLDAAARDATRH